MTVYEGTPSNSRQTRQYASGSMRSKQLLFKYMETPMQNVKIIVLTITIIMIMILIIVIIIIIIIIIIMIIIIEIITIEIITIIV